MIALFFNVLCLAGFLFSGIIFSSEKKSRLQGLCSSSISFNPYSIDQDENEELKSPVEIKWQSNNYCIAFPRQGIAIALKDSDVQNLTKAMKKACFLGTKDAESNLKRIQVFYSKDQSKRYEGSLKIDLFNYAALISAHAIKNISGDKLPSLIDEYTFDKVKVKDCPIFMGTIQKILGKDIVISKTHVLDNNVFVKDYNNQEYSLVLNQDFKEKLCNWKTTKGKPVFLFYDKEKKDYFWFLLTTKTEDFYKQLKNYSKSKKNKNAIQDKSSKEVDLLVIPGLEHFLETVSQIANSSKDMVSNHEQSFWISKNKTILMVSLTSFLVIIAAIIYRYSLK